MSPEGGYGDQGSAGQDAPRDGDGGGSQESTQPADQRAPEGHPRAETLPESDPGTVGTASADLPRGWDQAVDLDKDPAVIPDLAETDVPEELKRTIEDAMAKYPDRRSAVMPALHAAQALHGWCSPEALHQVAAVMKLTPAYLSMIASFYDMYNEEPVGTHHVYVCTGVACMPRRPGRVLQALQEEAAAEGLEDTEIRPFECLGACDMAPMASVDGRYVGPLDPGDAIDIVDAIKAGETPLPGRGLGDPEYRLPWGGRA